MMGEDVMDYSDRCRLCIAGSKRLSIDIFSPEGKRSKLQAKISKYLSLKIAEDDKLPSSICYQCLFRLETWVSFKKHCLDSDQTLKNWAFFCGAITPESYLNEANKSSENGSDTEKPSSSYFSSKNDRSRTPPPGKTLASGSSHTPRRTSSPSPSAPHSSSSSTSSQRRESEAGVKSSAKFHVRSPMNGVTRDSALRTSKSGRRKILRPSKAFSSSQGDEHQIQLIAVQRKVEVQVSPVSRKSEDSKFPKEHTPKQTSPTLPAQFKRKRGRPSKAWLKERAEAIQKLKEAAETQQQQVSPDPKKKRREIKDEKEDKELQELRELKKLRAVEELREAKALRNAKEFREADLGEERDLQDAELKEAKEVLETEVKEENEVQENEIREAKELRETGIKEARELRETEIREAKESREAKELREVKDIREARELREAKELRNVKVFMEANELKEAKELRERKETKDPKSSTSKNITEMIELDDPDFGSMMFTLSVIDSSAVPSTEKTAIYPESSTSVSSGRQSSDSCFKEEFSGFSNPNIESKRIEEDNSSSKVVQNSTLGSVSESGVDKISGMPLSPQRLDRKRCHSALENALEESDEKIKKLDETGKLSSLECLKGDDNTLVARAASSSPSPLSGAFKTDDDSSIGAGEQVTSNKPVSIESFVQYEEVTDNSPINDSPIYESDSDAAAPPMSPLSPARTNFEVEDLGRCVEVEDNDPL